MKKIIVSLLLLSVIFSFAACSSGSKDTAQPTPKAENNTEKNEQTDKKEEEKEEKNTEDSDSGIEDLATLFGAEKVELPEPADPKTVDYSKVDFTLGYEDGDKMQKFMEDYKNEVYNNKVVKITGIMSRGMMDPTKNSIMLSIGDGAKLGPQWIVVGADENTQYPADGAKIEITGVVIASWNNDWYASEHYIHVLPENIKDFGYPE